MNKPLSPDQISPDAGQFDEEHDDAIIGVALRAIGLPHDPNSMWRPISLPTAAA